YPINPTPAPGFEPRCEADIIGAEAWLRVVEWESQQWKYVVDCARLGPAARRRLKPLVIPAASFDQRGRGTIWDLRDHRPGQPILPLDFDQPIRTRFDTSFLAQALADYPDRELVSFVCRGVALKTESAPPDLVLCPHLVTLGAGMHDIDKTIRTHAARGAYGLGARGPTLPRRGISQGSTLKKDGTNRRTSDGGGPRKPTPVKSLNTASRDGHWIPEVKPTLDDLANDLAVLRHAGSVLGLELYQFTDDFKWFFNQLALHPSQWHLSTFLWLSSLEEDRVPVHVIEYVLGFGLRPSSNVAQRFAEAIMWLLRRRVDKDEAAFRAADPDPAHQAFFAERAALGPGQGRLTTARCFTDDSHFAALGVDRALSVLRHWGELTASIRVEMASFEKRQAGSTVSWLGVLSNSMVGTIVVPQAKTLKAINLLHALSDPAATVVFRDYRKITGLLEHIVGVVHARRVAMYALYEPHRYSNDPEQPVHLTPFGITQARAWIVALRTTPGRHCIPISAAPVAAAAPHDLAASALRLLAYTDAAKDGATVPCFGGWCHGYFFSFPIPPGLRGYPIPQLELLGMTCGVITFAAITQGCRADLISDSDTSVKIVLADSAHNVEMQWIHMEFDAANTHFRTFDRTRHAHGDINVPADFASRNRIADLRELAAQLGVQAVQLPVPPAFNDILARFEAAFGPRPAADKRRSPAAGVRFGEALNPGPLSRPPTIPVPETRPPLAAAPIFRPPSTPSLRPSPRP
ncbi:MAG: hypothetical protein ACO3ND_10740, partial [Opitutales bacterium]